MLEDHGRICSEVCRCDAMHEGFVIAFLNVLIRLSNPCCRSGCRGRRGVKRIKIFDTFIQREHSSTIEATCPLKTSSKSRGRVYACPILQSDLTIQVSPVIQSQSSDCNNPEDDPKFSRLGENNIRRHLRRSLKLSQLNCPPTVE